MNNNRESSFSSSWSDGNITNYSETISIYKDKGFKSYLSFNPNRSVMFYLCFICVVVLIAFMLYHTASGSTTELTFSNIIDFLQNFPTLELSLDFTNGIIADSWGLFDFLRVTINLFITILNVISFLFKGIVNVLSTLIYFFTYFLS